MRKIKEVLRLRFGLGLHQDQIARSCSIGQATVHRYLEKAAAALPRNRPPDTNTSTCRLLVIAEHQISIGEIWVQLSYYTPRQITRAASHEAARPDTP